MQARTAIAQVQTELIEMTDDTDIHLTSETTMPASNDLTIVKIK